jgi:hypothetical protein
MRETHRNLVQARSAPFLEARRARIGGFWYNGNCYRMIATLIRANEFPIFESGGEITVDIECRRGSISRIAPEIDVSAGTARELSNIRSGAVSIVNAVDQGTAIIDHDPSFRQFEIATRRVRIADAKAALVSDAVKRLDALESLVTGHANVDPDCAGIADTVKQAISDARRLIGAPLPDIRSRLVRPVEEIQPAYRSGGPDIRDRFVRS